MGKTIHLLTMDVDGTLTDGSIFISAQGEMCKGFHVRDGYAIRHILPEHGIKTAIITGRESDIVANRARELHIGYVYQGVSDKLQVLTRLTNELGIELGEVAYIGDDLNDISVMQAVGIAGCPADAVEQVKDFCDYVCSVEGGRGAVREFIEWLVKIKG